MKLYFLLFTHNLQQLQSTLYVKNDSVFIDRVQDYIMITSNQFNRKSLIVLKNDKVFIFTNSMFLYSLE